jgi:hypothetical protein
MCPVEGEINPVGHEVQRPNAHHLIRPTTLNEPEHTGFQPLFQHTPLIVPSESSELVRFLREHFGNLSRCVPLPLTSPTATGLTDYVEESRKNIFEDYVLIIYSHGWLVTQPLEVFKLIRDF